MAYATGLIENSVFINLSVTYILNKWDIKHLDFLFSIKYFYNSHKSMGII